MLSWLVATITHLGYLGIFGLMFLESIILPLPSELIMPLSGFVSARGGLALPGVFAAGFAGELVGALPWYFLGRSLGEGRVHGWLSRHGQWLLLRRTEIDRARRWFSGRRALAVLLARLAPGVHPLIGVPAGAARMGFTRFLFLSAIGVALWVGGLAWAGYLLGRNFQVIGEYLKPIGLGLGALALLGVAWFLVHRYRRAHAGSRPAHPDDRRADARNRHPHANPGRPQDAR